MPRKVHLHLLRRRKTDRPRKAQAEMPTEKQAGMPAGAEIRLSETDPLVGTEIRLSETDPPAETEIRFSKTEPLVITRTIPVMQITRTMRSRAPDAAGTAADVRMPRTVVQRGM